MAALALIMKMISVTSTATSVLRIVKRPCRGSKGIVGFSSRCNDLVDIIGAFRSAIEHPQLNKILRRLRKKKIRSIFSQNDFCFYGVTVSSLGMIEIALEELSPQMFRKFHFT